MRNAIFNHITGLDSTGNQLADVDSSNRLKVAATLSSDLIPFAYDYVSLTYSGSKVQTATYKTGGSSGTTVATLTIAYDVNNNISSVTRT